MALILIDGHIHKSRPPGIVFGKAHPLIGELIVHLGRDRVAIDLLRVVHQVVQRDKENILHLCRAGRKPVHPLGADGAQKGVHHPVADILDDIQGGQNLNLLRGNPDLLPGLPEGGFHRTLSPLPPAPGEADLPGLVAHQGLRPGLEEEAEFSLPLGQGDQNGILSHRALDAQLPVGKVVLHFRNGHGILSSSQDSGTVNLAKGSSSCQRTTRPWARLRGTSIRRWFRLPRKWSS